MHTTYQPDKCACGRAGSPGGIELHKRMLAAVHHLVEGVRRCRQYKRACLLIE